VIPAILLCISVVALGQFGLYYWRATIAGLAAQPVSDRVRAAAGIETSSLGSHDFRAILMVRDLVPGLNGAGKRLGAIRAYYSALETLERMIPGVAGWAENEMATCSRCVAVLVDRHLERNTMCAEQLRGM
jgi:hypothetical protein